MFTMSATSIESVQRPAQAWALDRVTCSLALMMLVQRGVLRRTASGIYVRG